MRILPILLCAALLWSGPAAAQSEATPADATAGAGAGSGTGAEAASGAGASPRAEALLEVLRDDAARAALIAELERLAAGGGGGAEAPAAGASAAPAAGAAPAPTLGGRLAGATQAAAEEAADAATRFVNGLAATQRRLSALWGARGADLLAALAEAAVVVAATLVAFYALRLGSRRLFARFAGAARGPAGLAAAFAGAMLADGAAVVLASAVGHVVALAAVGETGRMALSQSLFLNAFLVVELVKVAIRGALSPAEARLRPLPLGDADARAWGWRFAGLAGTLGYGLMLAAPLVAATVSVFAGAAVRVVVHAVVLLWAMALVWRHRAEPRRWFAARSAEAGGDATLGLLAWAASLWHWPALAWLAALFVVAVSAAGDVGPLLAATGRALGVAALGAGVGTLIGRAARRGVRLPPAVLAELPMLETRLNGFLRRVLGAARFAVFAVTLGAAVSVSGLVDVAGWAAGALGADFGGRLLSAALVALAAFAVWIGFASWVDYRLGEKAGATAREQTLLSLMRNAVTVAIIVLAGMIALSELGLNIGPLLASAGVLGLAIGFGAQKLVQDVITGVFIQLENAMNVGDVVTVGGISGVVEKLTIRSVSLRDLNGVFHVIPFSSVDMVSNFMKGFAFHVADLGIAYRESVEDGKAAMEAAFDELKANPEYGRDIFGPLEWFGVNALADSAVVLRARIRTRPGKQWGIGRAYNELMKKHCDLRGVEIPFPHLTLWFGEGKDGTAPPAHIAGDVPPAVADGPKG